VILRSATAMCRNLRRLPRCTCIFGAA
jgi:hypothetical protein